MAVAVRFLSECDGALHQTRGRTAAAKQAATFKRSMPVSTADKGNGPKCGKSSTSSRDSPVDYPGIEGTRSEAASEFHPDEGEEKGESSDSSEDIFAQCFPNHKFNNPFVPSNLRA
ncbi:unnamed protein product, partial [Pylaiella littoralis]